MRREAMADCRNAQTTHQIDESNVNEDAGGYGENPYANVFIRGYGNADEEANKR